MSGQQIDLKVALAATANLEATFVTLKVNSPLATPANSTITVQKGTIWFDANYIYVSVGNNVVKRAPLSSF